MQLVQDCSSNVPQQKVLHGPIKSAKRPTVCRPLSRETTMLTMLNTITNEIEIIFLFTPGKPNKQLTAHETAKCILGFFEPYTHNM